MTKFTELYLAAKDREGDAYMTALIVRAELALKDPLQAFRISKHLQELQEEFDEQILELAAQHKMQVKVVPSTPILVVVAVPI